MKYSLNSLKKHIIWRLCRVARANKEKLSNCLTHCIFIPGMTKLRNRSRIVISILDELWLHALPWEGIYTDDARPKNLQTAFPSSTKAPNFLVWRSSGECLVHTCDIGIHWVHQCGEKWGKSWRVTSSGVIASGGRWRAQPASERPWHCQSWDTGGCARKCEQRAPGTPVANSLLQLG